jgi:hypothetical protein
MLTSWCRSRTMLGVTNNLIVEHPGCEPPGSGNVSSRRDLFHSRRLCFFAGRVGGLEAKGWPISHRGTEAQSPQRKTVSLLLCELCAAV